VLLWQVYRQYSAVKTVEKYHGAGEMELIQGGAEREHRETS
jgi:hypothetical protein